MAEDTPDLEQYLSDRPVSGLTECAVCRLPEAIKAQVEASVAKTKHPRWKAISEWLVMQKQESLTSARISRHFERRHHERRS